MNTLKGKIVSSILSIAAIVTLIGFGVSSYAWFGSNKTTQASSLNITSRGRDVLVADNYVKYAYKTPKRSELVLTNNGVNVNLDDYSFFTTSILETNANCKIFVRFKLSFPNGYSGKSNVNIKLTSTMDFVSSGKVTDGVSNLIYFKFLDNYGSGAIPADSSTSTSDYYALCSTKFDSVSQKYSFVTGSGETFSKNKVIECSVPMSCFAKAGNTSDFIMMIDYQTEVMSYYKTHSNHTFDSEHAATSVVFIKDISSIDFSL